MARVHRVVSGECLSSIAARYGFHDYRTLYHHPENEALRRARPNPNVLYPGDEVHIPDMREGAARVPTTQLHRFQVRKPRKVLRLRLLDREGRAIANTRYELELGAERREGVTDGDGGIEEPVPVGATEGEIHFDDRTLRLSFGALNPLADAADHGVSGAQSRLRNLGYPVGPVDGVAGPRTRTALGLFQLDQGIEVTCELDDPTRARLEAAHGS